MLLTTVPDMGTGALEISRHTLNPVTPSALGTTRNLYSFEASRMERKESRPASCAPGTNDRDTRWLGNGTPPFGLDEGRRGAIDRQFTRS